MKYVYLILVGFYFAHLIAKAKVEAFSGLYWQFLLAQALLVIGGGLV